MTQIADLANESRASRARASTKLDITVLAGGPSEEREVSLQSGAAVAAALVRLGHKVTVRDISPADPSALEVPADFAFIALHGAFGEDGQVQDLFCIGHGQGGDQSPIGRGAHPHACVSRVCQRAGPTGTGSLGSPGGGQACRLGQ
jgi:hypothetical protein